MDFDSQEWLLNFMRWDGSSSLHWTSCLVIGEKRGFEDSGARSHEEDNDDTCRQILSLPIVYNQEGAIDLN